MVSLTKAQRTKKTTTLPASLLDQLSSTKTARGSKGKPSRKEQRKQSRVEKKQRKAQHFTETSNKRKAAPDLEDSPVKKKVKLESTPKPEPPKKAPELKKVSKPVKKTTLEKLVGAPPAKKDVQDDAYEKYLESKLGYASKSKNRVKANDGLDGTPFAAKAMGDGPHEA